MVKVSFTFIYQKSMIKYVAVKIKTVKTFNLQPFTKVEQFLK